jgi:hypothetical protein
MKCLWKIVSETSIIHGHTWFTVIYLYSIALEGYLGVTFSLNMQAASLKFSEKTAVSY